MIFVFTQSNTRVFITVSDAILNIAEAEEANDMGYILERQEIFQAPSKINIPLHSDAGGKWNHIKKRLIFSVTFISSSVLSGG